MFDRLRGPQTPNIIPGPPPIVDLLLSRLSRGGNEWPPNSEELVKDVLGVSFEGEFPGDEYAITADGDHGVAGADTVRNIRPSFYCKRHEMRNRPFL